MKGGPSFAPPLAGLRKGKEGGEKIEIKKEGHWEDFSDLYGRLIADCGFGRFWRYGQ
jgi:hypothetical protein